MTRRKYSVLLLLSASIALPLWAGTHSAAAFKKLQSLSGDWEGKDGHGMAVKTSFQVLASGTAVMETLSPSGMEEMVTLYSIDGDGIALVHYCPTNNQPRMRVVPDSDDVKELSFDFQGAGNLKSPSTGHQHHLVLSFNDADHIIETWTWRQDDKDIPMFPFLPLQAREGILAGGAQRKEHGAIHRCCFLPVRYIVPAVVRRRNLESAILQSIWPGT